MFDMLVPLLRQLPMPVRLPFAFFIAFVMPAPIYAEGIKLAHLTTMKQLPFPANIFVWVYGGGLQSWFGGVLHALSEVLRTVGQLTLVAMIAIPTAFVLTGLWWFLGPGAMSRRKQARRELWLNVHAQQVQDQTMRRHYEKAARAFSRPNDREAFEREVRRWD